MYSRTRMSKLVGWGPNCSYPTKETVKHHIKEAINGYEPSAIALFGWNRHCTSPETPEQVEVLNLIVEGMKTIGL